MGKRIRIANPRLDEEERTYLDEDYTSGVTLTVRNNDNFSANRYAVVGEPGSEQTEGGLIASISGNTTVTLNAGLAFPHTKSEQVYETQWNKISVERSVSEDSGFSEISNSPFNISWDDQQLSTLIEDSGGSDANYYRWRFYNSTTGTYSAYSGVLPASGLGRNTAGYVIRKVRRNPITVGVTDEYMYHCMNDLQDIVYEEIPKAWWFSKEGTKISTVADVYRYAISTNWSDFKSIKYLLYEYVNGDTDSIYPLDFAPELEFRNLKTNQNASSDDGARRWTFLPPDSSSAKGYIGIDPTPKTTACYIQPIYFFELVDIDSFSDTLVIPKPKIYEDYILYRINDDVKSDSVNAEKYNSRVAQDIVSLKKLSKRQLGQRIWRRYRGQRGYSRMFGEFTGTSLDNYRENYW